MRALRRENERLRAQRDILKDVGHPCRTAAQRFARMKTFEAEHVQSVLCAAFGVSRSGYHAWKTRPPSARQRADETLSISLCQVHRASRQTYSSPHLLGRATPARPPQQPPARAPAHAPARPAHRRPAAFPSVLNNGNKTNRRGTWFCYQTEKS